MIKLLDLTQTIYFSGEPPIRSRYARLLILMPPEPPRIIQGPVLQAVEDREVNLECVSVGGKPAAEVQFYITYIQKSFGCACYFTQLR